jgi:serine/threonine protein phosphatase PrpC
VYRVEKIEDNIIWIIKDNITKSQAKEIVAKATKKKKIDNVTNGIIFIEPRKNSSNDILKYVLRY